MTCSNIHELNRISLFYDELNGKKMFKKFINDINSKTNNKKVHLLYHHRKPLPICALPTLRIVVVSRINFLSFCFTFYNFIDSFSTKDIIVSKENIYSIAKCAVYHEVGHIFDPNIFKLKYNYRNILLSIYDIVIKYNINLEDNYDYKNHLPQELENLVLDFKKNIILREMNAWTNGKSIIDFNSETEKLIFDKMREFAIATYNYGDVKTILNEHNLKTT